MSDLDSYRHLKDQIRRWRQPIPSAQGRVWRRVSRDTVPLRIRVVIFCCVLLATGLALVARVTSVGTRSPRLFLTSDPVIMVFPNRLVTEERAEYTAGIVIDTTSSTVLMNNVVSTTDGAGIVMAVTPSTVLMNNVVYRKEP